MTKKFNLKMGWKTNWIGLKQNWSCKNDAIKPIEGINQFQRNFENLKSLRLRKFNWQSLQILELFSIPPLLQIESFATLKGNSMKEEESNIRIDRLDKLNIKFTPAIKNFFLFISFFLPCFISSKIRSLKSCH